MRNSYVIRWNSTTAFYATSILVTICIVLGLSSNIVMMGATVVSAVYIATATPEAAVAFMFYLLPFANVFKFGPGSTSIFTYIQLVVIFKLLLSSRRINRRFLYAWFLLLAWQAIGSQMQIITLIKQVIVPITVYMVLDNCRIDTARMTKSLAIGLLLSSLIGQAKDLIPGLMNFLVEMRVYEVSGLVYRFTGLVGDPNHYSSISILVSIGLICQLFNGKLARKWLIVVGVLIVFGLNTVSKSYFLMLGVVAVFVLLMCVKKKKIGWLAASIILFSTVLIMAVVGSIDVINSMLQRLTNTTDITTGRTAIWGMYLRALFSDPVHLLFGYGIAAEPFEKVAHNTFIDLLFYYGSVGSIVYMYPLSLIVGRKNRWDVFHVAPLICFLMLAFFLSYLMYYDLAFILIYVIAYLRGDAPPPNAILVDETATANDAGFDRGTCS